MTQLENYEIVFALEQHFSPIQSNSVANLLYLVSAPDLWSKRFILDPKRTSLQQNVLLLKHITDRQGGFNFQKNFSRHVMTLTLCPLYQNIEHTLTISCVALDLELNLSALDPKIHNPLNLSQGHSGHIATVDLDQLVFR